MPARTRERHGDGALPGQDGRRTRRLFAVAVLGLGLATGVTGTVEVTVGNAAVRIDREVVFPVGTGALLAAVAALLLGTGAFSSGLARDGSGSGSGAAGQSPPEEGRIVDAAPGTGSAGDR